MKDKNKTILIALSFIIAMILFVWGFNFLKGKSLLRNQLVFYSVYDNSQGLLAGDIVTINGMSVGTVTSLSFHPSRNGSIVVAFTIDNDLNIPDNTIAKLSPSLMGSTSINLILGDSRDSAQTGDTLMAGYDKGMLSLITEQILPLKSELENLLVSLNILAVNVNGILDESLKDDINAGVSDFAASMQNIKVLSSDIQKLVDSDDGKLTMVVNDLENITGNFSAVSDSLSMINYTGLVNSLEDCITEFNTMIDGINSGKGTAGQLVNNDSLYNNINNAVYTLQTILNEIKENPKKIKLSVF